jgi:hypothetical protein
LLIGRSAIEDFERELAITHALLFSRNPESRKLASRFYGTHRIIMSESEYNQYQRSRNDTKYVYLDPRFGGKFPSLNDFKIFRDRIANILRSMEEWRPRTFGQLFTPGYKKKMEWWVAMFGIFFGVISILIFAVGLWTAIVAQKQYLFTLKSPSS